MQKNYAGKGDELMKEAKKKLAGSTFGNLFNKKAERAEEAIEIFKQAATNYKLAKRWDEAAAAYLECVECDRLIKGGDSAQFYIQAANMKEKVNTAESVQLLEQAINVYIQNNRIGYAAKITKKIAEIYENDKQYTLAVRYYQDAADHYSAQANETSNYNNCLLKVAELAIYQPEIDYQNVIKILDKVADKYLQNKLTAPSAKDLYFKAVLLHLSHDDDIGASQALDRYTSNDPTFFNTRQQKFLAKIIQAYQQKKPKDFAEEWYELFYFSFQLNQIIPLDKWKTTILTKIKANIPGAEEKAAAGGDNEEGL